MSENKEVEEKISILDALGPIHELVLVVAISSIVTSIFTVVSFFLK